jgi:hypothetical protein
LLPIIVSLPPLQIGRDQRQRISKCFNPTGPVGGLLRRPTMFKGILVAGLVLLGAALLDQYLTNGRYTDAAMSMARQIRHSFRV